MAGHSHHSNIRHKKDRRDTEKCKNFLKMSEKIQSIVRSGNKDDYKKVFSLARENNFPREKVESIIKKSKLFSKNSDYSFKFKLFKFKFDIIALIIFNNNDNQSGKFLDSYFSKQLVNLSENKLSSLFKRQNVLKVKLKVSFEDFMVSSIQDNFFENISEVFECSEKNFDYELILTEKGSIDETIKIISNTVEKFEVERKYFPFYPLELNDHDSTLYFKEISKKIPLVFPKSKIFFNVVC